MRTCAHVMCMAPFHCTPPPATRTRPSLQCCWRPMQMFTCATISVVRHCVVRHCIGLPGTTTIQPLSTCLRKPVRRWTCRTSTARLRCIRLLDTRLDAGAKLDARSHYGGTPLHVAAALNRNPAIIAALVEAGADVDARNDYGGTPLHSAAEYRERSAFVIAAIVNTLVAFEADVNARNSCGGTPLHRAVMLNERLPIVAAPIGAARCSGFSTRPLAVGRRLAQPRMGDGGSA